MSTLVSVVTGESAPDLSDDGRAVVAALGERGIEAEPAVWSDPAVEWEVYDAALVRSCWDYHADPPAFREWLDGLANAGVAVLNPADVIRWNHHKFYLRELAAQGVPVLPTVGIDRGSDVSLGTVLEAHDWEEAVVKPAVGTSSKRVWRTSLDAAAEDRERFAEQVAREDVLVQAFAPEVLDGEDSLVFFGGEFGHARRSVPAEGEFRSHQSRGGSSAPHDPPEYVVEQSRAVLETAFDLLGLDPVDLPYARVDGVVRDGQFRLMELELIEPYLGLVDADAVDAFADAVVAALRRRQSPVAGR